MATLLAVAKAPHEPGYLPLLALAVALVVAMALAYRVFRDVKGEEDESLTEPDDLLGPLDEAFAAGQMSEGEYLRARDAIVRAGFGGRFPDLPLRPKAVPPASTGPAPP